MKTKFFNALSLAVIMAILVTSLALADNVQNDVTVGGNDTFTLGGSTIVNYRIASNNGDGQTGCNASDGSPAIVTINTPTGVTASPNPLSFTACGSYLQTTFTATAAGNYSITVSVNDPGTGTYNTNPATFTLKVLAPSDTTPPVITPNVSGMLGNNGWYVSDVTVSWNVSDPESTPSYSCPPVIINYDTTDVMLSCSASSAGGSSSQSVTIKRDTTAPTISGSTSPAANGAGWNNSGVDVSFSCFDGVSGIASCGPNQTLSGEGSGQSAMGTATDMAGNSTSATISGINIDLTAPSISGAASPAANSYGWNNTDVTVSFTCSDGLSGVVSCGPNQTLSGEGAGHFATGYTSDNAGNIASTTVANINIDKTAPIANASASPAANANGWYNTDVTVNFSGSDALSGLDTCDAPVVLSSEGAGQSASGSCTDKAGNVSAPATASGINIDKTVPSVSLVGGPVEGGAYYFGFVPAAPICSASDVLSGIDGSCSVSGYGTGLGSHTVIASATDKAGNSASASVSYTVLAWTLYGFYQPVDMNGVWNTVKGGSTVPFKFEIFAGTTELTNTSYIQSLQAYQTVCTGSGTDDAIETVATGGTSLRYDTVAGQFIYNWQTPKKPGTCYKVIMVTQDGSKLEAFFKLK